MKSKKRKVFDAVQMVREIREAMYKKHADPSFDSAEFKRIRQKWTKLLEEQEKSKADSMA